MGSNAVSANAATPRACIYSDSIQTSNFHAGGFKVGNDVFDKVIGSSGIALTITANRVTSESTTLSASATAGVSGIVASASVTAGKALMSSQSTTTQVGGSWTVPASQKTGWLAFGTFTTEAYNWSEVVHEENCTTIHHSGTAVSPIKGQTYGFTHS
ncbi:hypothetical protein [Jatrophihabitans sp. GAS493]|uniref:hypothetical protein n=1 Tax=Jatrophihabitans sp. GAS493 TaxID=1907575 RepID=UPI0012FDFC6C|nr:hypothetical protein [Jatrophihabitans sp. GAS493]